MRLTWPLTGRSDEMLAIEAALSAPDLSGIVVSGAAGIGKSRIARETLLIAASRGCEVHWAAGTSPARTLPLGVFASWVGASDRENFQLVQNVIEGLTASPTGSAVIVAVDDAHLLDDLSLFVLHQIVARRAAKVVLTIRDREPIPAGLLELWKGGDFARLDLQPLTRGEATTLLSVTLAGPLNPDADRRLWTLTRGNVLYLRNIVEQEIAGKRLARQHGYWNWTGDAVLPPGLVELIESRIGDLPTAVGDVVDALAIGEPIDLASLTRITDAGAVEEADMRGLVVLDHGEDGVSVRVAHPLYGEVRRRRAAPTRLRRLRGLVAAELAALDRRDDIRIVVRRATLTLDSDLEPDPSLLVRAAQGAVWLADLPLAERLADAAIRAGAGTEANFIRAHALSWLSRGEEADAALAAIPTDQLTDADFGRLAFLRATNMLWTLADPAGAKTHIDDAANGAPTGARDGIGAFLTVYWAAMGHPDAARASSTSVDMSRLPDLVGAVTAWAIAVASGDGARTTEAVAAAEFGYTLASRAFDAAQMRFVIADGHVGALLHAGHIHEASDTADRLRRYVADLPGAAQLLSAAVAGRAALGAGRLDEACSLLEPAVELMSAAGETNGFGYRYQIPRTIALAMRGSIREATAALAALEARAHPSWRFPDHERALARAWVAAGQGALTEAIELVLAASQAARTNGQLAAEVMCLQVATQLGDPSGAGRLHELATIVEGPRVGVAARAAAALKAGDAAELEAASHDFEEMGDIVAAADAAAHAAMAYRRQDLRGSAYGCVARADLLANQGGGVSTPALRQALERLPLTPREREIVMLIGDGASNRAIAARLKVSVRTVEGHIYRASLKTGATSRDQLGGMLTRHSPTSDG